MYLLQRRGERCSFRLHFSPRPLGISKTMDNFNPNLKWYTGISSEKHVRPRCPYASVRRCPRFYQSLSLLGGAGSTKIEPREDNLLLKRWKKSDLWPSTDEQATSISGEPSNPSIYRNFCPEVAFERFGLFALNFAHYADEIDLGLAHNRLGKMKAPASDWRWAWSSVAPMHYTECPLYSPLDLDASPGRSKGYDQGAPGNVLQVVLRAIWYWSPFWRNAAMIILIALVLAFAVWVSLPDQTKERLLDAFSNETVQQTKPTGK